MQNLDYLALRLGEEFEGTDGRTGRQHAAPPTILARSSVMKTLTSLLALLVEDNELFINGMVALYIAMTQSRNVNNGKDQTPSELLESGFIMAR